jgi:GNAT superfamily N-acetyltransferase
MTEASIRSAEQTDLAVLGTHLGDPGYFEDRLLRQTKGLGVLYTAWHGPEPVGDLYLWLEEAEEAPIREHLPGVPLLTHLEVREGLRSRGIGRALVEAAEESLVKLGHDLGALAVRTDNHRAARLYRKLGYHDWGRGEVVCNAMRTAPDGSVVTEPELCRVMVKDLLGRHPKRLAEGACGHPS